MIDDSGMCHIPDQMFCLLYFHSMASKHGTIVFLQSLHIFINIFLRGIMRVRWTDRVSQRRNMSHNTNKPSDEKATTNGAGIRNGRYPPGPKQSESRIIGRCGGHSSPHYVHPWQYGCPGRINHTHQIVYRGCLMLSQ